MSELQQYQLCEDLYRVNFGEEKAAIEVKVKMIYDGKNKCFLSLNKIDSKTSCSIYLRKAVPMHSLLSPIPPVIEILCTLLHQSHIISLN